MHSSGARWSETRRCRAHLGLVLIAAALTGCGVLPAVGQAPGLFAGSSSIERIDFEGDPLSKPPKGFEPRSGTWVVADSPTALSGDQVLVQRGDAPAAIVVKSATGADLVAGEVGLRVMIGSSGAGIACEAGRGSGYLLKLEPGPSRVVLLRVTPDDARAVATRPAEVVKGDWARVGILCGRERVVGYWNGKAFGTDRGVPGAVSLGLYADGGTVAQFDDLRYSARK